MKDVREDVGNLYRILRALEEEGIVTSEWSADLPGPAEAHLPAHGCGEAPARPVGRRPGRGRQAIGSFLDRYESGRG